LSAGDPEGSARIVEEQLGAQKVSFGGVPEGSHFARVLVAADYRMKRISMGLEPSPVAGLPSFVQLMPAGGGARNMLPRWWLAPDYRPLLRDPEGLAWELRGAAVKALAESDFYNASGMRERTAPADAVSQKWADALSRHYPALAKAEPAFARLRNCIDLAIVGALLAQENLAAKAGCRLPALSEPGIIDPVTLPAPKQIDSQANPVHKRKWMVIAGGVAINPWEMVHGAEPSAEIEPVRTASASADETAWWWD
jgi:hypothetical protein